MTGTALRAQAATVISAVLVQRQSLTPALAHGQAQVAERDRPLLRELSYGVLRQLPRLQALATQLLQRPLKAKDADIAALLWLGLYQLDALRLPAHAAVAATVGAADVLQKPWARGVLNATLRRFQREQAALLATINDDPACRWLLPKWLLQRLQSAWPEHWEAIASASQQQAPMVVRVNPLKISPEDYLAKLVAAEIAAEHLVDQATALRLQQPLPVAQLPGYSQGEVSVQDAGAQRAAVLLDAAPGQRVLDACAAPGGKTAHLQERAANQLQLTALEIDPQRLATLSQQLDRLGLTANCVLTDASAPQGDWRTTDYDRILLDAPCSGTGVIRRHPDIKWLRRDGDIAALAATQARLLDALWPLLKIGGRLLYVTCSLLPEENESQIAAFLAREPTARLCPIAADWGLDRTHGRVLLPTTEGSDGFFFALLERRAC